MEHTQKTLVEKFSESLGKEELFLFRGPFSPNLMWVRWSCMEGVQDRYKVFLQMYCVLDGKESTMLTSLDGYQSFSKKIFSEYWNNAVTTEEIKEDHNKRYLYIDNFYDKHNAVFLSTLSDEELTRTSDELQENFTKLAAETIFIEQFDKTIALSILGFDKKEWLEKIWDKGIESHFESFETRRNKVILSVLKNKSVDEATKELAYIYTDYWQPKSTEEIRKILENFNQDKIKDEVLTNETMLAEKADSYTGWYKNLDKEQKKFVEYVQYIMHARDLRKDPIAKVQYVLYLITREIASRINLDYSFVYLITPLDLLRGVEVLRQKKDEIMERKNGVEIFMDGDGSFEIKNCNPRDVYKELEKKVPGYAVEMKDTIQGQTASKGHAIGRVRVVMDPHSTVFEDGDILVTSMTRPEFVPLMKKAGAVITNEGGITCHAAIISRELKIPCVIGTKFATQVLKDGDMVEVDADNGVVRIIS